MRARGWLAVTVVALFAGGSGGAVAAPPAATSAADVYVRGARDIPQTVERILADGGAPPGCAFVFAFEAVTFAPPPGETGFTVRYGFHRDVEAWTNALAAEAAKGTARPIFVATSARPEPVDVRGDLGARRALETLRRSWCEDAEFRRFVPAAEWLPATARAVAKATKAPAVVVVYVADMLGPEQRWGWFVQRNAWKDSRDPAGQAARARWQAKLVVDGTYFDEEAVGQGLARIGARLFVVSPEAFFEDFTPVAELPLPPWAARPQFPAPEPDADDAEPRKPGDPPPPPRHRFDAATPRWFPVLTDVPWANHAPSFFGHWPYARAAAITGGRYVFYPFPPSEWLDACPADARLLQELAPELVARADFEKVGAGDRAWDAVDRAVGRLVDDTPWARSGSNVAWGAFDGRRAVRRNDRWRARHPPLDTLESYMRPGTYWRTEGHRILTQVLPLYAKSIEDVDEALAEADRPGGKRPHPRARADLALTRFWLAMSRFHLHALALYTTELERFRPPEETVATGEFSVAYVDTIRLSDCLDAYDGRRVSPEREAEHERALGTPDKPPEGKRRRGNTGWGAAVLEGLQDNFLLFKEDDPDYRARRDVEKVLKNVDARLRSDALDMIQAAQRVMERYAKTPWGWTVYYSVANTFVWEQGWTPKGGWGRGGGSSGGGPTTPKDKPTEPKPPPPPGGGTTPGSAPSSPGGPTTPGK